MIIIEYNLKETDYSKTKELEELSSSHLILENLVQKKFVEQLFLQPSKFARFVIGVKKALLLINPIEIIDEGINSRIRKGWNNYFSVSTKLENIHSILSEYGYERGEESSLSGFTAKYKKIAGVNNEPFSRFLEICGLNSRSELGLVFGHDMEFVLLIRN